MDNLYIPLILRNSDEQAGGLTELRFNNLYSYNRKERGPAKRQPEFSASAHQGFRSNSGTQGPKKIKKKTKTVNRMKAQGPNIGISPRE